MSNLKQNSKQKLPKTHWQVFKIVSIRGAKSHIYSDFFLVLDPNVSKIPPEDLPVRYHDVKYTPKARSDRDIWYCPHYKLGLGSTFNNCEHIDAVKKYLKSGMKTILLNINKWSMISGFSESINQ